jgi:hypothetical protein
MSSEKGLIFFPMRELEGAPSDFQLDYEIKPTLESWTARPRSRKPKATWKRL